jgi:hypothetical protein
MHLPFLLLFFLSFMNKSRQRFFPNLPFWFNPIFLLVIF